LKDRQASFSAPLSGFEQTTSLFNCRFLVQPQSRPGQDRHPEPAVLGDLGIAHVLALDLPALVQLQSSLDSISGHGLTRRLEFLRTVTGPQEDLNRLEDFHARFMADRDLDAASACVGAAIGAVLNSGSRFERFLPWIKRADALALGNRERPAALAFVLLHAGLAEIMGQGDIMRIHGSLRQLAVAAEQSGSDSLLLAYGALSSQIAFWRNDLAALEIILDDLQPIAERNRATPGAILEYHSCRGLLQTLKRTRSQPVLIASSL